jgi:hypothetical protein
MRISENRIHLLCIVFLCLINLPRFFFLEISPPGFYEDEAYGAIQTLCIKYFGGYYPLFTISAPGAAIYTPAFLYGEVLWTLIFGNSVSAFRSFIVLVTSTSILFLFLFVRNKIGFRAAFWTAFAGSIMPWSFIFSRIAWDPPIAVLFLVLFLWASTLTKYYWTAGVFIAISAYSYPPMRLIAPVLLILTPCINLKHKALIITIFGVCCIPLAWLMLSNPSFIARSDMLAIWSDHQSNPFRDYSQVELYRIFWANFSSYFNSNFLFLHGDHNLRSSIQNFGMLSWIDLFAYSIIPIAICLKKLQKPRILLFTSSEKQLIILGILGVTISFISASLTNEGSPHALRSLTAWVFLAMLTAILVNKFLELITFRFSVLSLISLGVIFFSSYLWSYFFSYPGIAKEAFQMHDLTIHSLSELQQGNNRSCSDIRRFIYSTGRPETNIGEKIQFAHSMHQSNKYLWSNWYNIELWGVWSNGKKARLYLPKPQGKLSNLEIELRALITEKHPSQIVRVKINGELHMIEIFSSEDQTLKVPITNVANDFLWIEIDTPNAVSPEEAGLKNGDKRKLGVGLISATFN